MKKNKKRKFGNLFKKLKKTTPGFHFMYIVVLVLFIMSVILLTYSLTLLNGIETFIRILFIIAMAAYTILFFFIGSALLITKKHTILIVISIITTLFTTINSLGYYYIQKTYNVVDNISKEEITYTTNLITLNKDETIKTIGILKNEVAQKTITEILNNASNIKYKDYIFTGKSNNCYGMTTKKLKLEALKDSTIVLVPYTSILKYKLKQQKDIVSSM